MLVEIKKFVVVFRREVTDRRFYKDESTFLHHAKKALIALGYDCIKKKAWKDGHLVDDSLFCIRDRKKRWMIFDGQHAIRNLAEDFDGNEEVYLRIHQLGDSVEGGLVK